MTKRHGKNGYFHVESDITVPSFYIVRNRKQLVEQSFYNLVENVVFDQSCDDTNNADQGNVYIEKSIGKAKLEIIRQPRPIYQEKECLYPRRIHNNNIVEYQAKTEITSDIERGIVGTEVDLHQQSLLVSDEDKSIYLQPAHNDNEYETQPMIQPSIHNRLCEVEPELEEIDPEDTLSLSLQHSQKHEIVTSENSQHEYAQFTSTTEEKTTPKQAAYLSVLNECLSHSGVNAYGVSAIEIWTMEEKELVRCHGGYWRDPGFHKNPPLERLEDVHHPEYAPCMPLLPGSGTAGKIWTSVCRDQKLVKWVELHQLIRKDCIDDNPNNVSLNLFAQAFGLATGLYFHNTSTNTRGIVVFYARDSVDFSVLSSNSNLSYLRSSADLLASVVSWKRPREEAIEKRREELKKTMIRLKNNLLTLHRLGALGDTLLDCPDNQSKISRHAYEIDSSIGRQLVLGGIRMVAYLKEKATMTATKIIKSGGKKPPRPLSRAQVIFALLGSFFSLLTLSAINEGIKYRSGGDIFMVLPPFGALVTCHYGLTSSPASQPRNSLVSILITSTMATCSAYIPVSVLPVWVRIPAVSSIGIATTLALGFTHPPAGAIAIVFAQANEPAWEFMLVLLLGYSEAIFFALVFINLHKSATFPMYWGIPSPNEWFCRKSKH